MKDQLAFMEALTKDPYDIPLRLVYADYLEELGLDSEAAWQRYFATEKWVVADKWLHEFAESLGGTGDDEVPVYGRWRAITYQDVIDAGLNWLRDGGYYQHGDDKRWAGEQFEQIGSETARDKLRDLNVLAKFWECWQIVTGETVEKDKQGVVFSCSC